MSTDATRCKVCGGQFSAKRIIIDGCAYHERCAVMSYPPHTHEDYSRLSDEFSKAVGIIHDLLGLELGSADRALEFLYRHSPAPDPVGSSPTPSAPDALTPVQSQPE